MIEGKSYSIKHKTINPT